MTPRGFAKSERLRARGEFLSLSARGRKQHTPHFLIVSAENSHGHPRIGLTVSRKVGGAVVRNRIKRFLREYFRLHKHLFRPADYNFIARHGAAELDFAALSRELDRQFSRSKSHV